MRSAPAYEPTTGLLAALNQRFHADYEDLVDLTRISLEREGNPVMIFIGNDLVFTTTASARASR